MLVQANPTVYPAASASVDVLSHPYSTKRKIQTLAQLYDQTLLVLNNPFYDSEEVFTALGSSVGGQLLKEQEEYSSGNSTPSSPRQSLASKTSSGVMAVMMTGSVSLEEQVTLLEKSMEMLAASVREKDEQIAFMMNKITSLTGKDAATSGQSQNPSLHEKKKNSAKAAKET